MKGNRKAEREHPVIERILKEISIIDKINRQWKEGVISEFQFSETLDRLLINLKRYQTELKQPDPRSLEKKFWRKKNDGFKHDNSGRCFRGTYPRDLLLFGEKKTRERNKIERDVNNAMGARKEDFLKFQMQKIIIEVMLDIREKIEQLIENLTRAGL